MTNLSDIEIKFVNTKILESSDSLISLINFAKKKGDLALADDLAEASLLHIENLTRVVKKHELNDLK